MSGELARTPDALELSLRDELHAIMLYRQEFFVADCVSRRPRYLQVTVTPERDGVIAEVSSDRFVPEDPLGVVGEMQLARRGWELASEDHVNHWRRWAFAELNEAAAELAVVAREVLGVCDATDLTVEHDGESRVTTTRAA